MRDVEAASAASIAVNEDHDFRCDLARQALLPERGDKAPPSGSPQG